MRRAIFGAAVWTLAIAVTAGGQQKSEKVDGYAEFRKGDLLVVDGQSLRADAKTRFKGRGIDDLGSIPLGFTVEARGTRQPDGTLLAASIEAKANDEAMFEDEVREATDAVEAEWLSSGSVYESEDGGGRKVLGRTVASGPDVVRVRAITDRLLPPYLKAADVRVHVVDTREWNAMAMGNGAIWVFAGLLNDMDDDEVAVVLGHELAHFTHEHTRRNFKRAMWGQLVAAGIAVAADQIDSRRTRDVVQIAGVFSLLAWQNGYGRDLEDQADRVGLRYAYEGGFDVRKGPGLWRRFLDKYGEQDTVTNFFFGNHSQTSARVRNLERELAVNYRQ